MGSKLAVIAFGGNAMIRQTERGTQEEQLRNARQAAVLIAELASQDYDVVIVHGNGPQVGNILIQMEEASQRIAPFTLDVCVAMSQGSMGYMLELALRNEYLSRNVDTDVATLETLVLVDENDPGMHEPTKPIGPFYPGFQADVLRDANGWAMIEDSGRGYRRVVASPRPTRILQEGTIKRLVRDNCTVIAAGGGGIPLARAGSGEYKGVEAVVDKDYAASLLAIALAADLFVILTHAHRVALHFGTSRQQDLDRMNTVEAQGHLEAGQFPAGSMGPKVESMLTYVKRTGKMGLITSLRGFPDGLAGGGGTWVVPEGA